MGTRNVVMKDSFVQQVDTPLALYDSPNNVFVAGFIGSPQMNFIDAKVEKAKDGGISLKFFGNSLKLPDSKAKKLEEGGYIGKEVVFGIRPENIHDEEHFIKQMPDDILEATVDVIEMLGSETLLYMRVGDINLNARVNPRIKVKVGDVLKVAVDTSKAHLFDKETEKVITN
jgi:multiple sugar transport system ATP-binding protein